MSEGPVLRVIRAESTDNGSVGILLVDEMIHSWTLQPDPADSHFHIPAGQYVYKHYHGTKHPETFEIVVPGHTALLFHAGNTEQDTEGCILLGHRLDMQQGKRVIRAGTSRQAFQDFLIKMNGVASGLIKIEDAYGRNT